MKYLKFIPLLLIIPLIIFIKGSYKNSTPPTPSPESDILVSTKPASLEGATLGPNQSIEFNFSKSLQDNEHTLIKTDPATPVRIDLSDDNKKVSVVPTPNWGLGKNFTVIIYTATKFRDGTDLKKDYIFHFSTINYFGV